MLYEVSVMKTYVSSFTYCDNIQTQITPQGPQHQIINPLQVLAPMVIPSHYSFSISCGIIGLPPGENNRLSVQFIDPYGKDVGNVPELNFSIPVEQNLNRRINTVQFNLDFRNVLLKQEGTYKTKIIINSETVGEYPIEVIKA